MEHLESLLEELRRRRIELVLDGDLLELEYPLDALDTTDTAIMDRVRASEQALIAHLRNVVTVEKRAPMSFAQQRLWFIDQLENGSAQYNQPVAIQLRGSLRVDALREAFTAIIERHEVLRTTFTSIEGLPTQIVHAARPIDLVEIDLRSLPEPSQAARIEDLISQEANAPFDLSSDLMIRIRLLRLDRVGERDDCILLVTLHHIACDGWSIGVLMREFAVHYEAALRAQPALLPELPMQYADYAGWQRERLQGELLSTQTAYWRRQLAGIPLVHALPLDRKRPAHQSSTGGMLDSSVDENLLRGLQSLALQHRTTLFTVLQAAFAVLVHRLSGEADVVMGVPIAGRTHVQLEPLIGLFVNTLVFRTQLSSEQSFSSCLTRVRAAALEAQQHQDIPFEMLVDELKPARSRSHSPLFQLLFSMQEESVAGASLPGLELTLLQSRFRRAKTDLELEIRVTPRALRARWIYADALFDRTTIERMSEQYVRLLTGIVADCSRPLWQLPLLLDSEAQRLASWNETAEALVSEATLVSLFEAQAALHPQRTAVAVEEVECSYGELNARANRLARYLVAAHGIAPGVMVGHCVERSLDMVIAILAIMKAGGAYVALDPGLPQQRLAYMLSDSATPLVLTQSQWVSRLEGGSARVMSVAEAYEAALGDGYSAENLPLRASADTLAYVIYTSGSTGRPKGTLNLHAGVSNRVQAMQRQFGLAPNDRVLQKTPLSFDVSVWELFWPLSTGAVLVLAEPEGHKDPLYLASTMERMGISVVHFVPSMLQVFLRSVDARKLVTLRYLITSGEALTYELQSQCVVAFPQTRKINQYGPTEAAIDVTSWCFDELRSDRIVPIGRPAANVQIHILDGQGQQVPIGVAGELYIGGVQVGAGYLNNAALTAERFVTLPVAGRDQRLYRTGDRARWLNDGQIEYLGRFDHQIKLRGMRIELGEIESAARAHADVQEAVAIIHGELSTQRLLCYVTAVAGKMVEPHQLAAELRRELSQVLPSYILECKFIVVPELPLSPNGKVDRRALMEMPGAEAASVASVAPSGQIERSVVAIWAEHLNVPAERISVTDNFFEVGGNSLLSLLVRADINKQLDASLTIADLFQHPTVQLLSRHIAGTRQAGVDRSSAVKDGKQRALRARARSLGSQAHR